MDGGGGRVGARDPRACMSVFSCIIRKLSPQLSSHGPVVGALECLDHAGGLREVRGGVRV